MKAYREFVLTFVQAMLVLCAGFLVVWTALALVDVVFGLGWGFAWSMLPFGPAGLLVLYVLHRVIRWIHRIVGELAEGRQLT
jgi:hypothetical protein